MKTFKQFISEASTNDLDDYRREVGGYITQYKNQSRRVFVSLTSSLDKCIEILNDAPFGAITDIAIAWYNNPADHNIRRMDKMRDKLVENAKKIKGFKTAAGQGFNVPMKASLQYHLRCLENGDPNYNIKVDYSKIDMWDKGKYKFDWVETNGIKSNLNEAKGEPPTVEARKGLAFLGMPVGRGGNPRKTFEEWKSELTRAKINAGYVAEVFKHQKKSVEKFLNPETIIKNIENAFNAGRYKEAIPYGDDLDLFISSFNNSKLLMDLLASKYFDIFSEITAIGK